MATTILQKHPAFFAHIEAQGQLVAMKASFSPLSKSGGGRRGIVSDFSQNSRRRMLRKLARINPTRVTFITLTYPERFPDPAKAKDHLRALLERIRRRFPQSSAFWRLELQERGAPHFHLLFCELPFLPFSELRRWWSEIINEFVDGHLPRVRIERIHSKRGAFYYVAKYCAKVDSSGSVPLSLSSTHICTEDCQCSVEEALSNMAGRPKEVSIGRFWGIFNKNHLPYAERLYAIIEIMTPVGFADCKALLNHLSPELYLNKYRGKVCFVPDSKATFRQMLDLLKPDMRQTFYNRFSRWIHENHALQSPSNVLHPNETHLRTGRLVLHAAERLRGRGLFRAV